MRNVCDTNVLVAALVADDLVLATAATAKAHCILTGDDDLLVLKRFAGIAILSPRAFVDATDRDAGS